MIGYGVLFDLIFLRIKLIDVARYWVRTEDLYLLYGIDLDK